MEDFFSNPFLSNRSREWGEGVQYARFRGAKRKKNNHTGYGQALILHLISATNSKRAPFPK